MLLSHIGENVIETTDNYDVLFPYDARGKRIWKGN